MTMEGKMELKESLNIMEEYRTLRDSSHRVFDALVDHEHMMTIQRINRLHDQQRDDLEELRKCVQYILEHTHVIQNALRNAEDNQAAVPMCSNIVQNILAVKSNIIESINNAKEIKKIMGVNYDPVMDNLLQKMEDHLKNWTSILNVASRSVVNSRALVDNIQNLVVAQQQMCSEVVSSNLFSAIEDNKSPTTETEEPQQNNLTDNQLNLSFKCSTPILNSEEEST